MTIALAPDLEAIAGFRCVRRLGRSSRGETWLVKNEDDSQRVLKWLIQGANLRNARKLTSYRHPFLINWDRFEIHGPDLYLIADWADETLDVLYEERLQADGKGLDHDVLLRYLEELGEVLDYLHAKHQLVHGRLTLSQVGIQHRHVKLLDWGITQQEKLLSQDWSLASLQYAAPEVHRGDIIPASDQYSLAALYCYASTGKYPFAANSLPEFFQLRRDNAFALEAVTEAERLALQRAMHRDPTARFPTCSAFVKALQKAQEPAKPSSKATFQVGEQPVLNAEPAKIEVPLSSDSAPVAQLLTDSSHTPTVILKSLMAVESENEGMHPDSAFLNLNNLAYHSKVQSFGILTPTMMIGMGRHGHEVLNEMSRLCHQRFDGVQQLPHVRIVALENIQSESTTSQKPGSLSREQYVECKTPAPEQLKSILEDEQVTQWLPQEQRSRFDQFPPSLGRLALATRYPDLRKRMQDECKLMLQSEALMKAKQLTGLSIRQDLAPTIYIIASLDESCSAGMIADLAYLMRSVIEESGWNNGKLYGLFFMPHESQSERIKATAYATLVELNHYTLENQFTARYTKSSEVTSQHPPFDEAYFRKLGDTSNANALEASYRSAADWLMRDATSELGGLRLASREATRAFAAHSTPWFSHGMTSLRSSHHDLKSALKKKLIGKLISQWLVPTEEVAHELRSDGERFLLNNVYSASSLLERFQHMIAVLLGREPAHIIDEWIAPLRKGAAARPSLENLAREIMQKVEQTFGLGSGYQNSLTLAAVQQEADSIALETANKISPLILQYLDKPGMRLGAALRLGKLLLDWINHHLGDLQASHLEIHQDMIRAERTITQMMSQEERTFAIMGRQRLVSQIVQDLSDYPSRVLKEDLFARAVHVFQHIKHAVEDCLKLLQPGEQTLRELQKKYDVVCPTPDHLLLDGEKSLDDRAHVLLQQFPEDIFLRLDADLTVEMARFQTNYANVCMGKGPSFSDVIDLLDNSLEECMEGMLPSEDAAEQLLTLSSQVVVEQLRQSYRDARPDLMENKRSRQGAFCLLLAPGSDAGQDLLQMAQATLPQIVSAPEGQPGEIIMYRETGSLLPNEIYPEGKDAYDKHARHRSTSPHSRFDISYWHALAPSPPRHMNPTPSAFELPAT